MASGKESLVSLDKVNCPICLETYRSPKSLPCLHSFCEACIHSYITNLEEKQLLETHFECPVCRKNTYAPAEGEPVSNWAKLFPPNYALVSVLETTPESTVKLCDSCRYEDVEEKAVKFCKDCKDYLCVECSKHHKKNRQTRTHILVSAEAAVGEQRGFIDEKQLNCHSHKDKGIEYYCKDDNKLCCSTCAIVNHRKCHDVVEIADVALEMKTNIKVKNLVDNLTETEVDLDDVCSSIDKTSKEFIKHLENIPKEVKKLKEKIIKKLDEIEEKVLEQCANRKKEEILEQEDYLGRCKRLEAAVQTSRGLLEAAVQHGSDPELFIIWHKLQKQYEEYKKAVQIECEKLNEKTAVLEIDSKLHAVLNCKAVEELGKVSFQESKLIRLEAQQKPLPVKSIQEPKQVKLKYEQWIFPEQETIFSTSEPLKYCKTGV